MRLAVVGLMLALGGCAFDGTGAADGASTAGIDAIGDDPGDGPGTVPAPDATPCPARHRALVTTGTWLAAEAACEADAPGQSHLVVLEDDAERAAIDTLIQGLPGDAWVGIVRHPGDPWQWRVVTGGPAIYAPFEGGEPNNMSNNQYVTAMRRSSGYLYDYGVDQTGGYAVCECDGLPPVDADYTP